MKNNHLTLIEVLKERSRDKHKLGLFKCFCGNTKTIMISRVKNNYVKSCGCLTVKAITKHGLCDKTPLYYIWKNMKSRCYYKKNKHYKDYGGRGIRVCDRWLNNFRNFYQDMGKRPKRTSLDRINNNGNYKPQNCRWATSEMQRSNKRNTHFLTYKNKTQTIKQWSNELKIEYATLLSRINRYGFSVETALTKPVKKWKRK